MSPCGRSQVAGRSILWQQAKAKRLRHEKHAYAPLCKCASAKCERRTFRWRFDFEKCAKRKRRCLCPRSREEVSDSGPLILGQFIIYGQVSSIREIRAMVCCFRPRTPPSIPPPSPVCGQNTLHTKLSPESWLRPSMCLVAFHSLKAINMNLSFHYFLFAPVEETYCSLWWMGREDWAYSMAGGNVLKETEISTPAYMAFL